jgi:hypothetical protein
MLRSLRRQTRRICCIVSVCLLFVQLAVSAYACPKQEIPTASAADVVAQTADMAGGCEMLDPASPNLCLQHCQAGSQLPDGPAIAIPVAFPIALSDVALPQPPTIVFARNLLARTTAPPLTVRNCCFRI